MGLVFDFSIQNYFLSERNSVSANVFKIRGKSMSIFSQTVSASAFVTSLSMKLSKVVKVYIFEK